MNSHVYQSIIYNSQNMKIIQVPINGGMNKEDMVHIQNGIVFSHDKGKYPPICHNMDEP